MRLLKKALIVLRAQVYLTPGQYPSGEEIAVLMRALNRLDHNQIQTLAQMLSEGDDVLAIIDQYLQDLAPITPQEVYGPEQQVAV